MTFYIHRYSDPDNTICHFLYCHMNWECVYTTTSSILNTTHDKATIALTSAEHKSTQTDNKLVIFNYFF